MSYLGRKLSAETNVFGLKLWVVIGIGIGLVVVLILFVLCIWLASRGKKPRRNLDNKPPLSGIPDDSKEIREVKVDMFQNPYMAADGSSPFKGNFAGKGTSPAEHLLLHPGFSPKVGGEKMGEYDEGSHRSPAGAAYGREAQMQEAAAVGSSDARVAHRVDTPERGSVLGPGVGESQSMGGPEVSHLGWGHWFTLRDLEIATDQFSEVNVLGEGGYGIVYRGQLTDGTLVAVKKLLNNRGQGQAEKDFRVEVDAIGRVRHKNLVRLLGYCAEGAQHRMLVYEYVDNGNLEQWLHGPIAASNALKWEERMRIAMGTAKGLSYLHEAIEPKVVHRDIKSSNILVDGQWNAKVSDFGLAKLLGAGKSHVTTRVMGTFGYVAPEYANTGLLNERSDVYSFGVLLMEIITGRDPIDYNRPAGEVNLVDWLKMMVGSRRSDEVADPYLESRPSSMALKRALLVALRCVDPAAVKRPKMGQVVHMLEAEDFPFKGERRAMRDSRSSRLTDTLNEDRILKRLSAKDSVSARGIEDGDSSMNSLHRLANSKGYRS